MELSELSKSLSGLEVKVERLGAAFEEKFSSVGTATMVSFEENFTLARYTEAKLSGCNTGNRTEGAMVCTSLGSLLHPLFYFLCYIHFSLSVLQ